MKLNMKQVITQFGSFLWLTLFSFIAFSQIENDTTIAYENVPANVPYSKVAKLSYIKAEEIFSYGDLDQQKIYYWSASDTNRQSEITRPILVFIHGGCWLAQFDINHSLPLTTALAMQGYDVYSIEYRRTGNGGEWPVALHDNIVAMEYIAKHRNYSKSEEVVILGHSAGGHLASLVAQRITSQLVNQVELYPLFQATHLIGLAPIIDLPAYAVGENSCQTATPKFMQSLPVENIYKYQEANPLTYSLNGVANKVMLAGGKDNIVPSNMAVHPNAKNIVLDDAGHFDWIHPGSPAFNTLILQLEKL